MSDTTRVAAIVAGSVLAAAAAINVASSAYDGYTSAAAVSSSQEDVHASIVSFASDVLAIVTLPVWLPALTAKRLTRWASQKTKRNDTEPTAAGGD